jgi:uncharacterized tellurite resistance protein B-like protein
MLVIGTFDWPKTLETGEFYCPVCDNPRKFRRRTSRPFLTIYFIPVIPIGGKQEYVECLTCKKHLAPFVLGDPNSNGQHSFSSDLLQILALTILEDGHVSDAEIARALDVQRLVGQSQLSRDELAVVCAKARTKPQTLASFLWNGKKRWNRDEKTSMVQAIFIVAGADGQISRSRLAALTKTQQILGLTPEEFQSCIVEAEQMKFP